MPIEEKTPKQLDESTVSIAYDGVPLPDYFTIEERFAFYRKQSKIRDKKKAYTFPGPKARAILKRASEVYATNTASSRIIPASGNGAFVCDVDGFLFIDLHCDAGVNNLGRGNKAIRRAIQKQLRTSNEFSEHHHGSNPAAIELARLLVMQSPVGLPAKVFFSNSGAEANEAARKLCLSYRYRHGEVKRKKAIYFGGGFAGRTAGVLAATSSKPETQRNPFWTHCDQENSIYLPYPRMGKDWKHIVTEFEKLPHEEIDRMLIEVPCQGEGGIYPIDEDALHFLFQRCKEEGIFVISDCVQTGMGRTGTLFGADCFSWFTPDILTMGKALGGYLPIGATIFRAALDWEGGEHSNTFGGGPLVACAALAAFNEMDVLLHSGAQHLLGYLIQSWLISFCEFPIVTDIRGRGAMWAIEFCNAEIREQVVRMAEEYAAEKGCGLRLLSAGRSAVRIMPPLTIDHETLNYAMTLLQEIIIDNSIQFLHNV